MSRRAQLPSRMVLLVLAAAMVVVTAAIWMSPVLGLRTQSAHAAEPDPLLSQIDGIRAAQATADAHLAALQAETRTLQAQVAAVPAAPAPKVRPVVQQVVVRTKVVTTRVPVVVHDPSCADFTWQQDAQTAYLKDLTDPYGLDGAPGGHNGTGIACASLPTDPHRAASRPVGAYVEPLPAPPSKAAILAQRKTRFGLYTTQSPYSFADVNLVASMMQKKPDTVGYFVGWDQPFRPDAVIDSWRRGALPLLTWESHPNGPLPRTTVDSDYALGLIISGKYDAYIDQFALGIKKLGMPLVIRLDQEMNGNWYAWSEDMTYNSKGQFVQMWQHVVDRFKAVGADKDVIWLWAPTRVDDIGHKTLAPYYPGDAYVDWVGMDGYYRDKSGVATFDDTFTRTLTLIRALSKKPIYLAEVGATESGGRKAAWITSFFAGLPLNPDIIGFSWFNIAVTSGTGATKVTNDWRINSSGPSILAFKAGIADPRYSNQPPFVPGKQP